MSQICAKHGPMTLLFTSAVCEKCDALNDRETYFAFLPGLYITWDGFLFRTREQALAWNADQRAGWHEGKLWEVVLTGPQTTTPEFTSDGCSNRVFSYTKV